MSTTATKSRPILFSGPMVRAILAGTKTQTRRVVKPQPPEFSTLSVGKYCPTVIGKGGIEQPGDEVYGACGMFGEWSCRCPYGQPGDELWVRETWVVNSGGETLYRADYESTALADDAKCWRPSIHMPRWASRITLAVTSIRVERLQDISEADATAEGIPSWTSPEQTFSPLLRFKGLWESINGPDSWDANPWVWVVEFEQKAVG